MAGGPSDLPRSSFLLGFFSVGSQIVILRECFVSFYGSEVNLGIVLACWLLWVGGGSLAAGSIPRLPGLPALLAAVQVLAALLTPLTVLLMRTMPHWSPVPEGEFPSLALTAVAAVLFTAGTGFTSGAWFAITARLPARQGTGPGRVYAWEALGALAGGLCFTFLAAGRLDGMETAVFLCALTSAAALLPWMKGEKRIRIRAAAAVIAMFALSAALLIPRQGLSPAASTGALRWPGLDLVETGDSPYGNLALVDFAGQKTLFANGVPSLSFPGRRAGGASLHIAILAAVGRKAALLIGGGLGGGVREILLHPIARLDYLEFDPMFLAMVMPHLPPPLLEVLDDPRLRIVHDDGRRWLRDSPGPYDVIIMDLPEPSTALFNRFYTVEFFRLLKDSLAPEGILSFTLPSSPNYTGGDSGRRNRSIYAALRSVFGEVTVLAGDGAVFLARADGRAPKVPDLAGAAAAAAVNDPSARPALIKTLLDPARADRLLRDLEGPAVVNSDVRPAAYFYHAIYWGALNDPTLAPLLKSMTGPLRFAPLAIPLVFLAAGVALRASAGSVRRRLAPSLAAFTTGWAAMSLYGLVLFSHQTIRGHLYLHIGLLTAFFMAGTAGGGFSSLAVSGRGASPLRLLKGSEAVFLLWCLVTGTLLYAAGRAVIPEAGADLLFPVLAAGTGFLVGFQFPLFTMVEGAERAGGRYYFLDLAGSAAGALLIFLWILPLLGFRAGFLFAGALKAASLTAFLRKNDT